jgi:hypothetical protein
MNKGHGLSAIIAYLHLYGREDSHTTPSYEISFPTPTVQLRR